MAEQKLVFFDIDGTLWGFDNKIPESTIEAVRTLRRNGHKAFICSGRTRAYIRNPKLLGIGFDGVISGCGTHIEYGEETLFYKKLDPEQVERTILTVRRHRMMPILEGREYLYLDPEEFAGDRYGDKLIAEMGDAARTIAGEWGRWEISKLSCDTKNADREACFAELAHWYDYLVHNPAVVEMVPKGFHKGKGVELICRFLGADVADTIAFGDGVNDLGMFASAGFAVAMGNGAEPAKAAADYVTAPMLEDGVWKACRHLGLI